MPSPFYNILTDGEPSGTVLALLQLTRRLVGKQVSNGYRLATDNVQDACGPLGPDRYGIIASCTVEKAVDFTATKVPVMKADGLLHKLQVPGEPLLSQ